MVWAERGRRGLPPQIGRLKPVESVLRHRKLKKAWVVDMCWQHQWAKQAHELHHGHLIHAPPPRLFAPESIAQAGRFTYPTHDDGCRLFPADTRQRQGTSPPHPRRGPTLDVGDRPAGLYDDSLLSSSSWPSFSPLLRLPPPCVPVCCLRRPPLRYARRPMGSEHSKRIKAGTKPVHGGASVVQGSILLGCHYLGEAPGPLAGLGSKRLSRTYGDFGSNLESRSVKGRGLAGGGLDRGAASGQDGPVGCRCGHRRIHGKS